MLVICRSLMSNPQLLILDEPSLGLAPIIVEKVLDTVRTINDEGVTVLLVEQNIHDSLNIARPRLRSRGRQDSIGRKK